MVDGSGGRDSELENESKTKGKPNNGVLPFPWSATIATIMGVPGIRQWSEVEENWIWNRIYSILFARNDQNLNSLGRILSLSLSPSFDWIDSYYLSSLNVDSDFLSPIIVDNYFVNSEKIFNFSKSFSSLLLIYLRSMVSFFFFRMASFIFKWINFIFSNETFPWKFSNQSKERIFSKWIMRILHMCRFFGLLCIHFGWEIGDFHETVMNVLSSLEKIHREIFQTGNNDRWR